jgi:hypothetical protein
MNIHTEKWDPPINMKLRDDIADHCVGYCGADLKVQQRNFFQNLTMTCRRCALKQC